MILQPDMNRLLHELSDSTLALLQRVFTVLLVLSLIFDHETTSQQLWWHYTGYLCVHVSHTNYVPWCMQLCMDNGLQYSTYMVVSVSPLTGRSHIRSALKGEFDAPCIHTTFWSRSFSVAAPQAWNHLPA